MNFPNITLIGIATAGKSSVGEQLANLLGYDFIDTDTLLENLTKTSIGRIPAKLGDRVFIDLESRVVQGISPQRSCVIATGGSVVYDKQAIQFLRSISLLIHLDISLKSFLNRMKSRGKDFTLVGQKENEHLLDLYRSREKLYEQSRHVRVQTDSFSSSHACAQWIERLYTLNLDYYDALRTPS